MCTTQCYQTSARQLVIQLVVLSSIVIEFPPPLASWNLVMIMRAALHNDVGFCGRQVLGRPSAGLFFLATNAAQPFSVCTAFFSCIKTPTLDEQTQLSVRSARSMNTGFCSRTKQHSRCVLADYCACVSAEWTPHKPPHP